MTREDRVSGYNYYSDEFEDEEVLGRQNGSGLRAQLEEALKEIKDLRSELNQEKRQKSLTDLFAEKGKDPAAAALVPDGVDPKEWLDKNAAFIADAKKEQAVEESPEGEGGAAPEVPDPALEAERQAMERINAAAGTGIPSTATADPIQKMKSFQTKEELLAYIESNGAG